MRRILLIGLLLLTLRAEASHIVGGEFEIVYLSRNRYRINMILYFDLINGLSGARDQSVTAQIYRKRDNAFVMAVTLNDAGSTRVAYTNPACGNDRFIQTDRIIYTTIATFSDAQFSDAGGYYISWQRCCRNYQINNIYSENPASGNRYAGQTFYLEFPAIVRNGAEFINSSPRLFPPLSDFGCVGRRYFTDFGGTDDDGDSLVYSLVTPLSTTVGQALPPPTPGPYPAVIFQPGFSVNGFMRGNPDLRISRDGLLTVTPTLNGLFVFAVKCEEFRDGVKIGELRRDFQMLVTDGCTPASAPEIIGRKKNALNFNDGSQLVVDFDNTVSDADRCVEIRISDEDSRLADQQLKENISIRAVALNYRGRADFIKLPNVRTAILTNGSTKDFTICFDKCPPFEQGPVQIGIVAFDDACALPLSDTLKVLVNIQPPANADPAFVTSDVTALVNEGDKVTFAIKAVDADGDPLQISYTNDGFSLATVGMTLTTVQQVNGLYEAQLQWDTRCNIYDFREKSAFELNIQVEDQDDCLYPHPDLMNLKLQVRLPGNADPVISTDLVPDETDNDVLVVHKKVYESLNFNVFGRDLIDRDTLVLSGAGDGFALQKYLIAFPGDTDNHGDTQSPFQWTFTCDNPNLKDKTDFDFSFIVVDNSNKCRFYKADTLNVRVIVDPPDNEAPMLTVTDIATATTTPDDRTLTYTLGQPITLGLRSDDPFVAPKVDHITLKLLKAEGEIVPEGYVFEDAEGEGHAESPFSWNPDCSIFRNGDYENEYFFTFITNDDRCYSMKADTLEVKVVIRDAESSDKDFLPPNFITPNGDEYNNFYAMVRFNEKTGELENILPPDNCVGRFVSFTVYNRWGSPLFTSQQRDFKWYPDNQAMGVYFYTLKYTSKEYKGTITLRN